MKPSYGHPTFVSEAGGIPYINIVNDPENRVPPYPLYTESLYREGGIDNREFSGLYLDPQAAYPRWCSASPSISDDFSTVESIVYHDSHIYSPSSSIDGVYTPDDQEDMLSWTYKGPSCSTNPPMFGYDEKDLPIPCPTLSSPASSSSYSDGSPSPMQLNEYTNVFDFDFSTASPVEFPPPSLEDRPVEALPSSLSRRRPSPCTASRSPRNLSPADFVTPESSQLLPCHTTSHDPKRRYPCLILGCARRFTSQYTLKVHMEAHRPKPRVSFPCTLGCSEKFSRQHDRLRHEVAKHGKICEFSCNACGRFFSSNKTLGNHKCPVSQGQTRWVNV